MASPRPWLLACGACVVWGAFPGSASAQVLDRGGLFGPPLPPRFEVQDPSRQVLEIDEALRNPAALQLDPATLLRRRLPPGFATVERSYDLFRGFPTFPSSAEPEGGVFPDPFLPGTDRQPPPVGPAVPIDPEAWPAWVSEEVRDGERFVVERAILVRQSDRVWWRAAEESAFVPLPFHDRVRAVKAGDVVEIRQKGEFEVVFQDGARLRAVGPIRLEVDELSEETLAVTIVRANHVEFRPLQRTMLVQLPDGSTLESGLGSVLWQARLDGWATLTNVGTDPVQLRMQDWSSDREAVTVPAIHDVVLRGALTPYGGDDEPAEPRSGALSVLGALARTAEDGRVLEVEAGAEAATVTWSGARFELPAGGALRLDPMVGASFPSDPAETTRETARRMRAASTGER